MPCFHHFPQLPERARREERPDRCLVFLPRLLGDARRSRMARAAMEAECRLLIHHLRPFQTAIARIRAARCHAPRQGVATGQTIDMGDAEAVVRDVGSWGRKQKWQGRKTPIL